MNAALDLPVTYRPGVPRLSRDSNMASITKEVTSGKATYGPWHQFYQRQLAVAKEVAGLENRQAGGGGGYIYSRPVTRGGRVSGV